MAKAPELKKPFPFQVAFATTTKLIGDLPFGFIDLELLDLVLDAAGDELVDAAIPGSRRSLFGAIVKARINLDRVDTE